MLPYEKIEANLRGRGEKVLTYEDIEVDVKKPASDCQCLNSRIIFQVREALISAMSKDKDKLEKLLNMIEKASVPGYKEALEFEFNIVRDNIRETAAVLGVINSIPSCKE